MPEPLPHVEDARAHLLRHFGLTAFRSGQAEVISAVVSGVNAIVVMPTGAGKSLCYQLPAVLLPGVTVVVSPLIALMKDQVEQLSAKGIAAAYINSSLSDLERADRQRRLRAGEFKLIYVAPERFRSTSFLDALAEAEIALLAIDEAHCISQWGHDFRPDYSLLGQVRKRLRPPRTVALTATATPEVRDDIARVLLMKDPKVFAAGFDRPNLFFEVISVGGDDDKRSVCKRLVREGGSGLIYCSTRRSAEGLHAALRAKGRSTVLYHAGMDDGARHAAQDEFMSSPNGVAVATNAFGMGIDKPDIRFVVHANIPRAVEAYYQEIGRAGRDGRPARAVLLFNHSDVFTQQRMIQGSHPPDSVFADLWGVLLEAQSYSGSQATLAARVGASEFELSAALRVFERAGKISRNSRGDGSHTFVLKEKARAYAPKISQARALLAYLLSSYTVGARSSVHLRSLGQAAGLNDEQLERSLGLLERAGALALTRPSTGRTIEVLDAAPFRELGIDLRQHRSQERQAMLLLRRMADYAYAKKCRRSFVLRYFGEADVAHTCTACDNCVGAPAFRATQTDEKSSRPPGKPEHSALAAEALRHWRKELSRELDIPAYLIFNDATLYALATALPIGRAEFLAVKGTGETRWERFGPKVTEICALARAAGHLPAPALVRKRRTLS